MNWSKTRQTHKTFTRTVWHKVPSSAFLNQLYSCSVSHDKIDREIMLGVHWWCQIYSEPVLGVHWPYCWGWPERPEGVHSCPGRRARYRPPPPLEPVKIHVTLWFMAAFCREMMLNFTTGGRQGVVGEHLILHQEIAKWKTLQRQPQFLEHLLRINTLHHSQVPLKTLWNCTCHYYCYKVTSMSCS